MSKGKNLTLSDLPLFATDDQLGEAILGWARRKDFDGLATLREIDGMPKSSTFWGGRYVPAVKAFLDVDQGLPGVRPLKENGVEGVWQSGRRKTGAIHDRYSTSPPSRQSADGPETVPYRPVLSRTAPEQDRARYGYTDENGNDRQAGLGAGKVRVAAPDGRKWTEDAKETDPALWQRKRKFVPRKPVTGS
jgi:hypothetical protein